MDVDQQSVETEFSIAIYRPTGDKWQSKRLFLAMFDPRSSIVKGVIVAYPVCLLHIQLCDIFHLQVWT